MRIILFIKQVQDGKPSFDPDTHHMVRTLENGILNYDDGNWLEALLRLKETSVEPITLTVLSMGTVQSEEVLRQALALGADEAYLLSDDRLAGADTLVTAKALATAVEKIGVYDLVCAGFKSQDGRTGNIGPMVAEILGIPQVSYVSEFELTQAGIKAVSNWEDLNRVIGVSVPCMLINQQKRYELRTMSLRGIQRAMEMPITTWGLDDLEKSVETDAKTRVFALFDKQQKRKQKRLDFEEEDTQLSGFLTEIKKMSSQILS